MYSKEELKYIAAGRHKARTDLLWLCNYVLDMRKVVEHVHGPLIRFLQGFPVQGKDEFIDGQFIYTPPAVDPVEVLTGSKRRLILAPRGWYKTSINIIAHSIQWILNYPDVTILLTHASQEVAEQILATIKQQFQNNNVMRYFFPEFCPPPRKEWGTQQQFNCPARKKWTTAPTIQVSGIETIRTGMHYHVLKFTDIVDEKNTATKEQCEKIVYRYGMARNLLISPKYWIDIEGTRYNFSDLYGRIIDEWLKQPEDKKTFSCFTMGCFKKDVRTIGKEVEEFTPDELDAPYLLDEQGREISRFPEEWPWEALDAIRRDPVTGEELFASQQLNNPVETSAETFSLSDLRWKTPEELEKIPFYRCVVTVDLGETNGRRSDPTVITVCKWDRANRRYVIDCRRGKWLPDRIVDELFETYLNYKPDMILIEETGFLRGLNPTVTRRSQDTGVWLPLQFLKRDTQKSKQERIMSLQPWFRQGLIYFSTALSEHIKEQIKHELTRFPKYVHDDILDTLADQFEGCTLFGKLAERPKERDILRRAQDLLARRAFEYSEIYGTEEDRYNAWSGLGAL